MSDGLVIQPFPVIPNNDDQSITLASGLDCDATAGGLAGLDSVSGGFDPVCNRVAHDVEERLECLVLDSTVHAGLVAFHDKLDLAPFDPRCIVEHAR